MIANNPDESAYARGLTKREYFAEHFLPSVVATRSITGGADSGVEGESFMAQAIFSGLRSESGETEDGSDGCRPLTFAQVVALDAIELADALLAELERG